MSAQDQNEPSKRAAELLSAGLVVIDLETSAEPDDPNAWIIEIGLVDAQGETLLDTKLKPGVPVKPVVERVTGLEERELKDAPGFTQVYGRLKDLLRGKPLGAYGAENDRTALERAVQRFQQPPLEVGQWVDLAELYMRYCGGESFYSLEDACRNEGIPVEGAHQAVDDARMALKLVQKMAEDAY